MTEPLLAVGVMSGTSLDGIDLALIRTDGAAHIDPIARATLSWPRGLVADLRRCINELQGQSNANITRLKSSGHYSVLEERLSEAYVAAIETFMVMQKIDRVDLIGVHGQTVCHHPPYAGKLGQTWQLGDGALIAHRLKTDVITRFRDADMAAGGQGAPLAPLFHAALVSSRCPIETIAVVNLGGVANLTWVDNTPNFDVCSLRLLAFDTGPGSALIDDETRSRFGRPFDQDGGIAAQGKVSDTVLKELLSDLYFDLVPPKSLDRQYFHSKVKALKSLSGYDAIATLTAFTIESLVQAGRHLPSQPDRWLICGGGRHNRRLMTGLEARLPSPVEPIEAIGCNGDSLEAECFAWLAVRSQQGLPLSLPETTGVQRPTTGGGLYQKTGN